MRTSLLQKVWPLMEEAFPACERRTFEHHKKVMKNPLYHFEMLYEKSEIVGFLGYWELGDWLYAEHLAMYKDKRGNGIGGNALSSLTQKGRTVLDVQIPPAASEELIENRRIRRYERLGFVLQPYAYYQPAYDGIGEKVPLALMASNGGILSQEDFAEVRNAIYRVVHGVDAASPGFSSLMQS